MGVGDDIAVGGEYNAAAPTEFLTVAVADDADHGGIYLFIDVLKAHVRADGGREGQRNARTRVGGGNADVNVARVILFKILEHIRVLVNAGVGGVVIPIRGEVDAGEAVVLRKIKVDIRKNAEHTHGGSQQTQRDDGDDTPRGIHLLSRRCGDSAPRGVAAAVGLEIGGGGRRFGRRLLRLRRGVFRLVRVPVVGLVAGHALTVIPAAIAVLFIIKQAVQLLSSAVVLHRRRCGGRLGFCQCEDKGGLAVFARDIDVLVVAVQNGLDHIKPKPRTVTVKPA